MSDRSFSPTPRQRHHKRLARRLVEAVGGDEAAALFCRVGKSQLSDYGNPHMAAFMPGDVIEELEAVAGTPVYTAGLARMADHLLIALPHAAHDAGGLVKSVLELSAELGDVARAIEAALTDETVTGAEAEAALDQLAELDAASARLRIKLQNIRDGER